MEKAVWGRALVYTGGLLLGGRRVGPDRSHLSLGHSQPLRPVQALPLGSVGLAWAWAGGRGVSSAFAPDAMVPWGHALLIRGPGFLVLVKWAGWAGRATSQPNLKNYLRSLLKTDFPSPAPRMSDPNLPRAAQESDFNKSSSGSMTLLTE